MHRYDVISGIIFILSIVDFALAAPVLVQEKRQASADVVHIPKNLVSVLGKRGGEGLDELLEEYLNLIRSPFDTLDGHASSSSTPNPVLSTAYSDPYHPLMESSGPSSTAPMQGDDEVHGIPHALAWTEYRSDHELMAANAFFKSWKPLIIESSSEIRLPSEVRPSSSLGPKTPSRHMLEELFKTWKPPTLESSEVHASSSSAPSPALSSANPDSLVTVEPSGPSAATEVQAEPDDELKGPLHILALAAAEYGSDSDFDWEQEISRNTEDPKPPDWRRRRD